MTTEAEEAGIHRIRQRRSWVWYVLFSFLPAIGLALLFGGATAANLIGYLWLAAWAVVVAFSGFSRCPRCGHVFSIGNGIANPWRRSCGNCGLSIDGER